MAIVGRWDGQYLRVIVLLRKTISRYRYASLSEILRVAPQLRVYIGWGTEFEKSQCCPVTKSPYRLSDF